tara:strand:+ start:5686 stop:6600 length:915 start_codon:yes stop_codon:yes gene_type:complete
MLKSKNQIIKTGERFRDNKELPNDWEVISDFKKFRSSTMKKELKKISKILAPYPHVLGCRLKRVDTIIRKLQKKENHKMNLVRMDDIIAYRIITDSIDNQIIIKDALKSKMENIRTRNYIESPKNTGYRAIHLTYKEKLKLPEGENLSMYPTEIQLRTYYQHLWSTMSESFGEQSKDNNATPAQREYLLALSDTISNFERKNKDSQIRFPSYSSDYSFFIIHYDKYRNELVSKYEYGNDINGTIEHLSYIESKNKANMNFETVLVGLPGNSNHLEVTHLRYFTALKGQPLIPEKIKPSIKVPQL